ncbi:MAG: hypothetical protein RMH75_05905 [Archaeoglobaceae archaeon]|nr:hypothetical protein [Archaeoglobaceae archaeon]
MSVELENRAIELVKKYIERGSIPKDELDEELMLILEDLKLAIPLKSEKDSLAWITRQFGGDMEIPYIIRFFFKFEDWKTAIIEYFQEIGEKNVEEFVEIFIEIKKRSKNLIICGEEIVDIALKHGRDPGTLIAELKGSGLISPTVGCGSFGRAKAPLYNLNKFIALLS